MEQRREITSLAQIKCLIHPLRSSILLLFGSEEPLSVQRMAEKLGLPHGKVYYHVRLLVRHGFLEEVGHSTVNGIEERFYLPAAATFTPSPQLSQDPSLRASLSSAADDLFKQLACDLRKSVSGRSWSFHVSEMYLTEEERSGLGDELEQVFKKYRQPRPGARLTRFTGIAVAERDQSGPGDEVVATSWEREEECHERRHS